MPIPNSAILNLLFRLKCNLLTAITEFKGHKRSFSPIRDSWNSKSINHAEMWWCPVQTFSLLNIKLTGENARSNEKTPRLLALVLALFRSGDIDGKQSHLLQHPPPSASSKTSSSWRTQSHQMWIFSTDCSFAPSLFSSFLTYLYFLWKTSVNFKWSWKPTPLFQG